MVRALVPVPASFSSTAAGGEWRQAESVRFQQVLTHVRGELAGGKPVCLYGAGDDGVLALAWSGLAPVDCTVSVGARLDPPAMMKPIKLIEESNRQRLVHLSVSGHSVSASAVEALSTVTVPPTNAQLHRELPALYGLAGSDQLADPAQWAPQLPLHVMLAYDMQLRIQQEFAAESGAMRGAIRKAGKNLTYFVDESVRTDDIQSRQKLFSAVIDYVRSNLANGTTSPLAAAH